MTNSKIIYSINVRDIQEVSKGLINRNLSEDEIKIVERELGDYIDWHNAIELVISHNLKINIEDE